MASSKAGAAAPAKSKSAAIKAPRAPRRTTTTASSAVAVFDPAAYHHEIATAAYHFWLERGDAPGSPEEDWLRAEEHVRNLYS